MEMNLIIIYEFVTRLTLLTVIWIKYYWDTISLAHVAESNKYIFRHVAQINMDISYHNMRLSHIANKLNKYVFRHVATINMDKICFRTPYEIVTRCGT